MSLSQEALLKQSLNLQPPWYIRAIEFDHQGRQLDIYIDFEKGCRFPCSSCGQADCSSHDTIDKVWRDIDFFQFKTYLHCRVPRTECDSCGIKQIKVPWARKSSGFTLLMDFMILLMAKSMPMTSVAEIVDEHDTRLWRVLHHYVQEAGSVQDISPVESASADETSRDT
jgi:transposase